MSLKKHWKLWVLSAMLMMVSTACFQGIGDELQPNAISQLASETPTATEFIPTATDEPTATPTDSVPSATPTETTTPTQTFTPTATETPTITPMVVFLPTETETPTPTEGVVLLGEAQSSGIQQPSSFELTATVFVAQSTQTQEVSLTATAFALGIGATPTPDFSAFITPTPSDFELTMTAQALPQGFVPTQQPVQAGFGADCFHEIRQGENMFRLSLRYGVSVQDLATASNILNPNLVLVGQMVRIPRCGTTGITPPPTSTPTLSPSTTTGTGGVTAQSGGFGTGGVGTTSTGTSSIHIVKQYETLFQLSLQYNVSVACIANANGIANINNIIMGLELIIPSGCQ